ncbi:MAG: hypothetical protein Q7U02_02210, partial [Desulfosalsimonadaceae bacterium]|nr:hypothetical protein [Desulfosalsimonadaceae bacterium]
MVYFVLGGIGWLIGVIAHRIPDAFYGLVLGLMVAEIYMLRKRLTRMEGRVGRTVPKAEQGVAEAPARSDTPVRPILEPLSIPRPAQETVKADSADMELPLDELAVTETAPSFVSEPVAAP